jgi:hypothetical protein
MHAWYCVGDQSWFDNFFCIQKINFYVIFQYFFITRSRCRRSKEMFQLTPHGLVIVITHEQSVIKYAREIFLIQSSNQFLSVCEDKLSLFLVLLLAFFELFFLRWKNYRNAYKHMFLITPCVRAEFYVENNLSEFRLITELIFNCWEKSHIKMRKIFYAWFF